ncbi:MAG TPA: hypothetical protein VK735_31670 [Pseudonocardia sp.]|uniref:hypothetical protein n=1 Tax=Pseudonocardia sp. TaxID=60912 RepID=UPI002C86E2ED|nr:hypothetical protein [Pseudonocardia sp.]HTF52027.1 hypothetical protein [Pseudonocardia sp.]
MYDPFKYLIASIDSFLAFNLVSSVITPERDEAQHDLVEGAPVTQTSTTAEAGIILLVIAAASPWGRWSGSRLSLSPS